MKLILQDYLDVEEARVMSNNVKIVLQIPRYMDILVI